MRNKLQKTVATKSFFSSRKMSENRGFIFAFTLALFLLISGKGFAQLSESFDTGIPGTWTLFGNGVGTSEWSTTLDGYSGTQGVSINPSADNIGDQNMAQYFLVTPQIAVPENGEIQFYTKQTSEIDNGAEYQIRISTAAQPDINGFNIVLQSYTETTLNVGLQTEYEKKIVEIPTSIPSGLNVYIAFVAVNTQDGANATGDEWFVDEVSILEGCIEVEDDTVVIEDITVDSALVTWSHPTATNFEIQIVPTGGVPADSGIPVTGTSYSLLNLDNQTEFDVYLSAICGNDTQSAFTGPYTFETLKYGLSCDAPIVVPDVSTTPYVLADNLANWVNPDEVYTTEGANCIQGNGLYNYLNGDKVFLTYTPTQDGLITITHTTFDNGDETNNCYNAQSSLFVYDSCASVGVNCIAGLNIINGFEPGSIDNLFVEAGETYVIVVSSPYGTGAGICFELEISGPTCAAPADFVYNNLTQNSVSYSWDNIGGFSDSWEYVVVPTGSGEPTGSGIATNTNLGNTINGLTTATTYDFYARSICNGVPGDWSNPNTFTTQCTTFDTPFFTDFSTATNDSPEPCWTTINVNDDNYTWAFIGGYATLATGNTQNENNDIYASPRINFDGTPKRIRYKHRATQGASTYTVKLSTTGVGYDDFTTVVLPSTTINNNSFQEIIVDLPEDIVGEVNIAWIVEPNASETALRVSIDDVTIEDKPSCPDPLNPFVLQITDSSAWLFWTVGDEETEWEVAIQDLDSGVPTTPGVITTSNFPYIVNGLDSGHRYEYYVRAVCDTDDFSEWVGPVPFTTLCTSYDTPFYESFNDDDYDTKKFCWEITDANNDSTTWFINDTYANIQPSIFTPASSYNDYLISPAINLDGTPKALTFDVRADFSLFATATRFGLEVLMSTTNTSPGSFSVISPLEIITNGAYEEKTIIVEGSGTVYFAFRVPPEFSGTMSALSIDNVRVNDAPSCPNPTDLVVDTTTATTADLSWSPGYQETAWNIVVQPEGSGIPTTTGIAVTSTDYNATGLTSDTNYEFYVMSDCETGDSEWVGPMVFRTLCTSFTSPFVETFNTDSDSESCWQTVNNNGDYYFWEFNSATFPYEGDEAAAILTTTNGNSDDWLISPTITITENQRLRFYYRVNSDLYIEDLDVLLSTNGTGLDQFTTQLYDSDTDPVVINNEEYREKIINFPAGISGDINIAFHVPYFPPCTCGYRGYGLFIDNVNIEDVPACAEPTNITFNNITDTQAQVTWDANGSETAWEISVQPTGSPAPVGDTDPAYLYSATTNPFTLTGLTASSEYDVYVRAICDGSESEWSGPIELLTLCSFENLCQYTFVLTSGYDISASLEITQNNQVTQSLPFNGEVAEEFPIFLCSGVEFSVYFATLGSSQSQYDDYQFDIINNEGVTVYSSPTGIPLRRVVYEGTAICGAISCPQPTDLTISETSVFSWTPGGSETQWEVAVQPYENGTLPQSGTIVSTNSYTPTASDFNDPNAVTYEYFVRAICGTDDQSYWSGPFSFVRNDDVSTAIPLPINSDDSCDISVNNVSFIGATVSSESMTCEGSNTGDIWFDFTAESLVHIIEINGFTGQFYLSSGDIPYPDITMTLYKDNGGSLEEISCTYDKVMVTMYSSELVVGDNYKLRLSLKNAESSTRIFNVCLRTPSDSCLIETVNGDFEDSVLGYVSGITSIATIQVVPGWRTNLTSWDDGAIFIWEGLVAPGFEPYDGSQCVQILADMANDPEVKGYYRDFDTSETTLFDFNYAHLGRSEGNIMQVYAGPPGGPYTMINENAAIAQAWTLVTGEYQVPENQNTTRFVFKASGDSYIGNIIDAVSFTPNNEIITPSAVVDCTNPIVSVAANGTGTWIPDANNPGNVIIDDANSNNTNISGFLQPGVYTFTWQTRYCENSIAFTYNGISDVPTIETPLEYCLNTTALPLTAMPTGSYSLVWYTQAVGGTGTSTAPIPDTSVVGDTSYYVANADANGCESPRVEIIVTVNDAITPEISFSYETTCIVAQDNPTPDLSTDFETGGLFTSPTLTVDATTGEIDVASATEGIHDVVYTYNGNEETCISAGVYTATITFTEAVPAITTFDYGETSFCELENTIVTPNLVSGFTTGGSFSSTTLTVDETTGALDLSTATIGNHDITYTYLANETACEEDGDFTLSIEITEATPTIANFTYTENSYCSNNAAVLPELATGFTTGGIFSAEDGLSIDAATGEITFSTSTVGDYTVSYQVDEDITTCTEGNLSTFAISIQEIITPELSFSYTDTCELVADNVMPLLNNNFVLGGTFSSATLTVDSATGAIDITSATAGTHNVTYTFAGDTDMCILSGNYTATITFTQAIPAVALFDYGATSFCELNATTLIPNLATDFALGGTFSSTTLSVDAITGALDLSGATSGMHDVVYTFDGDITACLASVSFTVTIEIIEKTTPITSFTYSDDVYCATSTNVLPELAAGFTTGGTFSAETGLTINSTTGEVNVSSSAIGNYTINYEVVEDSATCTEASISTFNITILDAIEASIDGACNNEEYWLTVSPINSSYNPDEVTYTWMDANGNVVGENSELFNVTAYADQNPNLTIPTQFTVNIGFGNCQTTASFTTDRFACRNIPRGISPDGNGKNDSFDLTGFGVTNMIIFNRYGKEVYSFSGNYSNQWNGKSNKGKELPDGTYFYKIQKEDGSSITGWVYINRAH
ncbi:choice-of-anchor J domain-containing protein [Lacinutrix sp. C3R15]|uniref:choice-of-anchor J domain-containing protein n=1 Tax=Flavobacteriaceae TaxID=49546 RepID=UPI001C0A5D88|nr:MULTISPECIES: choice-of-anchor J domain-containing protein [Flavobacteriaceae]MBU2938125.1 choice-of-anchor J domain-containing protein [Lacinutrix sp. C3R15]MDO6621439.1 choice-of-anchor J domain-containing protein [Oceanihabitans sp. 1_MG-2023]